MKTKIFCLLLAMVMLVGVLAGCSSKKTEDDVGAVADTEESSRISMTLSLWLPTEEGTTEEAVKQVEEALNKLTTAKYNTAIEFHAIPRSEYWETVKAHMDAITVVIEEEEAAEAARRKELKALRAQGIKIEETETEAESVEEEETMVNDIGVTVVKYPEVGEKQMDIFLVTSYEDYMDLIDKDLIECLDSELSGASKILNTYIYPTYFEMANENGLYAIPNNHPVGEFQYLLLNKELVETYDYDIDDLKTLLKAKDFIIDIGNQHLDGVVPLLGEVEAAHMIYFGSDQSEWSLLAQQIAGLSYYSSLLTPKSIFNNSEYVNTVGLMKQLKSLGYLGDGMLKEGEKFAAAVISGDPSVLEPYEDDYYINVYGRPVMEEEDVFGAMFAVSAYTKNLSRSMEIITYLNTDPTFRTVLQYGVQGVHWDYEREDSEDTIKILNNDYQIKLTDTGNVYMTYPGPGISKDVWKYGKEQNLSCTTSPYMKFPGYITEDNEEMIKELDELSKEYKERLDNIPYEEYETEVLKIKQELKANTLFQIMVRPETPESIALIYNNWHDDLYPSD